MEEDFRLQNVKQRVDSQTLQDDRHLRYYLNAEKRALDMHILYSVCLQLHKGLLTIATLSNIPKTRNQLYLSGDAIQDQYCAIYICENDTINSGESEREMLNANIELNR
ncbi:MAG: hypothetical protein EZS28_023053 [Streblomastix strix]|uniref:Uncharacterized protein n=1 Tax=Streblomastix strix TaxID=222440 RepID=A0A5J4VFQ4_9EUKA|nr:MAG: hypothetical protein EZS28_023053 [Streblomastix strix]